MLIFFRITSSEDMEAKYLRMLSMSLIGYGKYFDVLSQYSKEKIEKLLEKVKAFHSKILGDGKFWKLAHHNNAMVRKLSTLFNR